MTTSSLMLQPQHPSSANLYFQTKNSSFKTKPSESLSSTGPPRYATPLRVYASVGNTYNYSYGHIGDSFTGNGTAAGGGNGPSWGGGGGGAGFGRGRGGGHGIPWGIAGLLIAQYLLLCWLMFKFHFGDKAPKKEKCNAVSKSKSMPLGAVVGISVLGPKPYLPNHCLRHLRGATSGFEAESSLFQCSSRQRVETSFYKGVLSAVVGLGGCLFICGRVGRLQTGNRDKKRVEEDVLGSRLVETAAFWGVFYAVSSNACYQLKRIGTGSSNITSGKEGPTCCRGFCTGHTFPAMYRGGCSLQNRQNGVKCCNCG